MTTYVLAQAFTEESMAFQTKMVANGGLGQATYLPDGVFPPTLKISCQKKIAHRGCREVLSCT